MFRSVSQDDQVLQLFCKGAHGSGWGKEKKLVEGTVVVKRDDEDLSKSKGSEGREK